MEKRIFEAEGSSGHGKKKAPENHVTGFRESWENEGSLSEEKSKRPVRERMTPPLQGEPCGT